MTTKSAPPGGMSGTDVASKGLTSRPGANCPPKPSMDEAQLHSLRPFIVALAELLAELETR